MGTNSTKSLRAAAAVFAAVLLVLAGLGIYAASRSGMDDAVVVSGDFSLDNTQLAYFYWSEYFYFSGAYGDYLDGLVDFTKPLSQQSYSEEQSWEDYLLEETLTTVREAMAMVFEAEAKGYTLSQEGQDELDVVLESFRETAETGGYETLDGYLQASYGPGANEASFTEYLGWSYLASEYADSLYEAIDQPAGQPLLPRTVIQHPSLWCYIESFGAREGDACLVAESDTLVVGAIWVRYMHGCGYVDDDTPEISLSLYPAYRNNGIGSQLLNSMLDLLKNNGVKKVSLSVSRTNRAVSLYKRFGFEIIDRDRDLTTADYLMQRYL